MTMTPPCRRHQVGSLSQYELVATPLALPSVFAGTTSIATSASPTRTTAAMPTTHDSAEATTEAAGAQSELDGRAPPSE